MNVLLNELSYLHAQKNLKDTELIQILKSLAEAIRFFRALTPINQVTFWVLDQDIYLDTHAFLNGMNYKNLLSKMDHEDRIILLSMFQRLNQLVPTNHGFVTEPILNISTVAVPTFLHAHAQNYGMLSIFSHNVWETSSVHFNATHKVINVRNWPNISFKNNTATYLNNFKSFFIKFLPQIPPDPTSLLPYRKISNVIFRDQAFTTYYKSLPLNGRLAVFQTLGSVIAELNGYKERQDLNSINSSKEKKRNIFESSTTGNFISIDYEKGAFEYLDSNGYHLGEFSFEGKKLQNADTKGKHDIKLTK